MPAPSLRRRSRLIRTLAVATAMLCTVVTLVVTGGTADASGTLLTPSWTVSTAVEGAVATYTYSFVTATTGTISKVTMTVPALTAKTGTLGTGTVTGIGAGTPTLASTLLTYAVTTPKTIPAGTAISIPITKLKNTTTVGSSYTSTVTTKNTVPATIDSGTTSPPVTIAPAALKAVPTWTTVTSQVTSATGISYKFGLKTAAAKTIKKVTMTVPPGTGGTPALGTVSGIGGGTIGLATNVLTYTVASPVNVIATTTIAIVVTNLVNTGTPISYASQVSFATTAVAESEVTLAVAFSGALTSPSFTVSSHVKSTTTVTYTYTFTTASTAAISVITMTLPTGSAGTPVLGTVTGIGAGAIARATATLTYTVTTPVSIAAGTTIVIPVTKITNTATANNYTSTITTKDASLIVDTGTTGSVLIAGALKTARWTLSKTLTGTAGVTYAFAFKTATAGIIKTVTMSVPPGTAGTPVVGTLSNISTGVPSLATNTLTFTVATPANIAKTTTVSIQLTGLTNTTVAGSYTSQIITNTATLPVDAGTTAPAAITSTALTNPTWTASTAVKSTAATYTYTFITATTATIKTVTMTVPTGTAGATLIVGTVSGIGTGTAVLATNTVTYTVTTTPLTSIAAGTPISIAISGFTNTATIGTSYSSTIATRTAMSVIDSGITSPVVAIVTTALKTATVTTTSLSTSTTGTSYTYKFETATTTTIKSITMTVPPGTGGTAGKGTITSTTAGFPMTGTILGPTNNVVTYTFATAKSVTKTKTVSISVTGLTNTAYPGSYPVQITTVKSTGAAINSGVTTGLALTGTLTNAILSLSNHKKGTTGVTYTYSFTTASAGVIKTITMSLPSGSAGTAGTGTVTGIGSGSTVRAGTTLTYTVTSPVLVAAGTAITIPVTGLTNTSTAGNYTTTVTTKSAAASIDTGTTPAVTIAGALTSTSWLTTNPVTSTTGVSYTFKFKTATLGTVKSVAVTVPPGTTGTPVNSVHTGLGTGTATTSTITNNTIIYTLATAKSVAANTTVTLTYASLVNTSTAGSYTSQITTSSATSPIDFGTTGAVAITPPLTSPTWTLSTPGTSKTGVSYTYGFTTQAANTVSKVTFAVPSGTGGTPALGTVSGIGAGAISAISGNTITYTVNSPAAIAADTAVSIQVNGLTNTSTAGGYTSTITTKNGTAIVDTGTTPTVTLGTGGALTSVSWYTSSSATGASGVSYTYGFNVHTSLHLTSIRMSVPARTGGTPVLGAVTEWSSNSTTASKLTTAGGRSITRSGTTLVFSFNSVYFPAGSVVSVQVTGLTNTSTAGSYTAAIVTRTPTGTPTTPVDTGTSEAVTFDGSSLVGPFWTPSSTKTSQTGASYTYGFTTATTATLSSVTMTVPPGTSGTPAVGTVTPSAMAGGTVSLSGQLLTYTFTHTSVSAGTVVRIQVTNLTNTTRLGTYGGEIVTKSTSGVVDTGALAARTFTAPALSTLSWSASSTKTGGTTSAYTFDFTVATALQLSSVTMSVPPGTGGTPAVGVVSAQSSYSITLGTKHIALSGTTLTFTFTPVYMPAGTVFSIQITGLTNTSTAGSYNANILTVTNETYRRAAVDSGTTSSVTFNSITLTSLSWSASSTALGATGVDYIFSFGVSATTTLDEVTMSVPPGTGGTVHVGTVTPPSVAGGTVSLATGILTYTFANASISPSTTVSIEITNLTNTTTRDVYASTVIARNASGIVASGSTPTVTFTSTVLTSMSWSATSTTTGATNTTYTWGFTTAPTGATLTSVTMTVPATTVPTSGTPGVGTVSVYVPGTGTLTLHTKAAHLSVNTITFSFASIYVGPNAVFSIQITGLTNTPNTGTYSSSVTTKDGSTSIDSGSSPSLSFSSNVLSSASWSVSTTAIGVSPVTYTYTFKIVSPATLTTVTMTVPLGTTKTTLGVGSVSGLPSGGTPSLSSTKLKYVFGSTFVGANTTVTISFTGLKNTTHSGAYTSVIIVSRTGTAVASGSTPSVTFTANVMTNVTLTLSSNKTGHTNTTYTWTFTTKSTATLTKITLSVPTGTGGAAARGTVTPTTINGGTPALTATGKTVTYSFTAAYVPAGTAVSIQITGLTNASSPSTFTSSVATKDNGAVIDSGTTSSVTLVGGALASPTWSTTSTVAGTTGVHYTYTFTTASTSTLSKVTMTVPSGTGGTPAVGTVTPAAMSTGHHVSLAGTVLTYTFTATPVAAGTAVSIQLTTVTNTSTPGTYHSTITTFDGSTSIDTGTTGSVTITASAPTPQSLTFTNACASAPTNCVVTSGGATSITLIAIPGAGSASTASVILSVKSNLTNGYRVRVRASGLVRSGGGTTFPEGPATGSSTRPTNALYASASLSGSGSSGAALCSPFGSVSPYVGYSTSVQSVWNATASTGAGTDKVTITNAAQVSITQPAGLYTGTISYAVVPATSSPSSC
jgi:hypothetical protein